MSKDNSLDVNTDRASPSPGPIHPPAVVNLPALPPTPRPVARRRGLKRSLLVVGLLIAAGAGGVWWLHSAPELPPGIAWGNGRVEADEIDIDTKFAGRVAKLFVDEGDMVTPGQVVAVMDTQDLQATLRNREALVRQAQKSLDAARANVDQRKAQVILAKQELSRVLFLVPKGFASKELLDQRQQQMDSALAALKADEANVGTAQHALDAAKHEVELYQVNIADNTLVAPRLGRIQYRVANVGEVLPAGGKVFTMIDATYVYMDIYLPTAEAGRVKIGGDARIVLDAYPTIAIPARVVFLADQAQFTPKTVETKDERDKLMFRVRVRVDPERLAAHAESVRSGLPGVAYVRVDPAAAWPARLQGDPAR
jgi:HlyD family secretion protein